MQDSGAVDKIMAVLKHELRIKGIRNRDLAARLEVSETTVKRYLRGEGVHIPVLEKLAEIVDLDLLSLVVSAQQQGSSKPRLNTAQQEALARSPLSRSVFFFLQRGMAPAQIAQELELTPQKLDAQLAKLQALLLIRRMPNNQVATLATPYFDDKDQGPLMNMARDLARRFLAEINLRDESCEWFYGTAWLSQASVLQVREMVRRFRTEINKLGTKDVALSPREAKYYQFFIGAQATSRKRILRQDW